MVEMLIPIVLLVGLATVTIVLLVVPWRFPQVGFVGSMLWTALAGAVYFANVHNPDPWAHIMDDVQHVIGIGLLSYAALWLVVSVAGKARLDRVGRVGRVGVAAAAV